LKALVLLHDYSPNPELVKTVGEPVFPLDINVTSGFILLVLVDGYDEDMLFRDNFDKMHPKLAEFMREA
jgi:hypothetical protein